MKQHPYPGRRPRTVVPNDPHDVFVPPHLDRDPLLSEEDMRLAEEEERRRQQIRQAARLKKKESSRKKRVPAGADARSS